MSYSIALFHFVYNDVIMKNVNVEYIYCVGEGGDASFIYFDGGEEKKKLLMENVNVNFVTTNGPFIKIKGEEYEIDIINSNIQNITSYGSVIEDTGKKVNKYIHLYNIIYL